LRKELKLFPKQNALRQPSKMQSSHNEALWVPQRSRGVRARTWV
jgi:hypothetical protein